MSYEVNKKQHIHGEFFLCVCCLLFFSFFRGHTQNKDSSCVELNGYFFLSYQLSSYGCVVSHYNPILYFSKDFNVDELRKDKFDSNPIFKHIYFGVAFNGMIRHCVDLSEEEFSKIRKFSKIDSLFRTIIPDKFGHRDFITERFGLSFEKTAFLIFEGSICAVDVKNCLYKFKEPISKTCVERFENYYTIENVENVDIKYLGYFLH